MTNHKPGVVKGGSYLCLLAVSTLLSGGCGGGFPPKELWHATVEVHEVTPKKKLIYENQSIGLVLGMFQVAGTNEIVIIGWKGSCLLSLSGDAATSKSTHAQLGVLPPVSKIGSFISDGYIQADFDNDGSVERIRPIAISGFKLENTNGREIARTMLDRDYWFEPKVTWSQPHLLLVSTDGMLFVFDNHLERIRSLPTPGIKAPLHISGGSPLGHMGRVPFVSVFGGRGGWHRTILFIHSPDERVIYKEILIDDFDAIWPLPKEGEKYRFLLGGRGQVWKYSFEINQTQNSTGVK